MAEILADLERIAGTLGLDRDGLGSRLMDIATREILIHMTMEVDPDGIAWAPLSEWYARIKAELAPQAPMAVFHGLMKTWEQVAGERVVTREFASMTYGVDVAAKVEAVKFTEGGLVTGTAQPPRPFYGLTTEAIASIADEVNIHFGHAW